MGALEPSVCSTRVMENPGGVEAPVVSLKRFTDTIAICESGAAFHDIFSTHEVEVMYDLRKRKSILIPMDAVRTNG